MKKITNVIAIAFMAIILFSCGSKASCEKFLKEYEIYVNKTVDIVKKMKANPSDMTILSEYTKLLSESTKWMPQSTDCKNDPEFLRKCTDIQLRLIANMKKE